MRLKSNKDVFERLLQKQKKIQFPVTGLGINFGTPNAKNTIVKVCNTYCGPCSEAHRKIDKLLSVNPNIAVKIIFQAPNDDQFPPTKPVKHFLAMAETNVSQSVMTEILDEWYFAKKKDYDAFAKKFPVSEALLLKQGQKVENMAAWVSQMEISFTPTLFVNGYQLPESYIIEDLQYLLMEK